MTGKRLLYRGYALVYLQGEDALEPARDSDERCMTYFVGSALSGIRVSDYRQPSVEVARRTLAGEPTQPFADAFNQPAWVEVRAAEDGVEVRLRECRAKEGLPILWMGVSEGESLPEHYAEWEVVRRVSRRRLAFASLIP